MIKTLADTIIWYAKSRMKSGAYHHFSICLYAVLQEVSLEVMKEMCKHKPKKGD